MKLLPQTMAIVLLLAATAAPAGKLEVPLKESELIVWSQPAEVDFWVPPEITILENPMTQFLADTRGMVLYAFHCDGDFTAGSQERQDVEGGALGSSIAVTCARVLKRINRPVKEGQPRCVDACAIEHPPVLASRRAVAQGDWSLVERHDGSRQWAYKGHPLYRYQGDNVQGYPAGSQTGGVWENVRVDGKFQPGYSARRRGGAALPPAPEVVTAPGVKLQYAGTGYVFADHRGMTLYSAGGAGPGGIDFGRWKPLQAPVVAVAVDDWSVTTGAGGIRQWLYKGNPVFTCGGDVKPGEVNCADGVWTALTVRGNRVATAATE